MKKILVTGANGFIGNFLLQELKTVNKEIYTFSRTKIKSRNHFRGDFFDDNNFETVIKKVNPSILVHLAWETSPNKFYTSPHNKTWSKKSINMIDKFFSFGGEKFIFMSSCEEYGIYETKPNENSICNPASDYGIEKNKVSRYLDKNYEKQKWVILRNYFICGPNEKKEKLLSYMVNQVINNNKIILQQPHNSIDFIDVRDVVRVIKNVIEVDFCGILNVGNSMSISPLQLANKLIDLYGSGYVEFKKITNNKANSKYIVSDNSKLINSLNFKSDYHIYDTLKDILEVNNV